MKTFYPMLPVLVAVAFYVLLYWLRAAGGAAIGRRVRQSDHLAWEDAVRERAEKFERYQKILAKGGNLWGREGMIQDSADLLAELKELRKREPKV